MNVALAQYYGSLPTEKVSEAGLTLTPLLALRALWKDCPELRDGGAVKTSSANPSLVELLGGAAATAEKLAEARPWLEAWDKGEEMGYALARQSFAQLRTSPPTDL